MDLDAAAFESKDENARKLLKGVEDLHTYVKRNREFVPNYGERYRNGERIASGFVELAINQVVSKPRPSSRHRRAGRKGPSSVTTHVPRSAEQPLDGRHS